MAETIMFYIFATTLIVSAIQVVSGRNPVHSVLFLILSFVNSAGLFLLCGAELLAMLLVIVYVGAVAVLFLFVVMMLDIDFRDLRTGLSQYSLMGAVVGGIMAGELAMIGYFWATTAGAATLRTQPVSGKSVSNAHALGQILYTDYFYLFQVSGLILLVAMIGAIVLTLRVRKETRKQDISHQLARSPANTLQICKVPFRQGLGG
jgi:NADH-quinone oxidoreductase subunit J